MPELSPNIHLKLTPESSGSKTFRDFRLELAGDDPGSNMMLIDSAIKSLQDGKYELPSGGIPESDLSSSVRASLELIESATQTIPVTPQQYGAVGDGATDDTQAFKDALEAADVVLVPAGEYKISETIYIGNGKTLIGENKFNTIIRCASTDVLFGVSTQAMLRNFKIQVRSQLTRAVVLINEDTLTDAVFNGTATINSEIADLDVEWWQSGEIDNSECACFEISLTGNFGPRQSHTGFYALRIRDINARGRGGNPAGYFIKTYLKNNKWVTSGEFHSCKAIGFRWGVFQGVSDTDLFDSSVTGAGEFTFESFEFQCTESTQGYIYVRNNGKIKLINCQPWDWHFAQEPFKNRAYVVDEAGMAAGTLEIVSLPAIGSHQLVAAYISDGAQAFRALALKDTSVASNAIGVTNKTLYKNTAKALSGAPNPCHCLLLYQDTKSHMFRTTSYFYLVFRYHYTSHWSDVLIAFGADTNGTPYMLIDGNIESGTKFGYFIDDDDNVSVYAYRSGATSYLWFESLPIANNTQVFGGNAYMTNYYKTINTFDMPDAEIRPSDPPAGTVQITDIRSGADGMRITDSEGYYTSNTIGGALAEIGAKIAQIEARISELEGV